MSHVGACQAVQAYHTPDKQLSQAQRTDYWVYNMSTYLRREQMEVISCRHWCVALQIAGARPTLGFGCAKDGDTG